MIFKIFFSVFFLLAIPVIFASDDQSSYEYWGDPSLIFGFWGDTQNYFESSTTEEEIAAPGAGGPEGGGGGGPTVSPPTPSGEGKLINYTFVTKKGERTLTIFAGSGHNKSLTVRIINLADPLSNVTLSCNGDNCDWVTFQNKTFSLGAKEKKITNVIVTVPLLTSKGTYNFELQAKAAGQKRTIDLTVKVGLLGETIKPKKVGILRLSPLLIALLVAIAVFILSGILQSFFIEEEQKRRYILLYSTILAMISFFITLILLL